MSVSWQQPTPWTHQAEASGLSIVVRELHDGARWDVRGSDSRLLASGRTGSVDAAKRTALTVLRDLEGRAA